MSTDLTKLLKFNMMEKLLLNFCRPVSVVNNNPLNDMKWDIENSLTLYREKFDGFDQELAGKDILDFGCGQGIQCLALALQNIKSVTGVDTNPEILKIAKENREAAQGKDKIILTDKIEAGSYDLILSQNSFEHYDDPKQILDLMFDSLRPGGKVFATFGPLWNSPYGAHYDYITKVPWVHKFYSERSLIKIRKIYRDDDATTWRNIPGGMNCFSLRRFEKLFKDSNFEIEYMKLDTVKDLPLAAIPVLREYFVNHFNIILRRP